MLAKRLPTILTPLPPAESLQTTRIDAEDSQVLPAPQVDVSLTHVRRGVPDGQDVADHHFLVRHAGVIEPVGASGQVVDHDRTRHLEAGFSDAGQTPRTHPHLRRSSFFLAFQARRGSLFLTVP